MGTGPDRTELRIRFAVGTTFGLVFGLLVGAQVTEFWIAAALIAVANGLVFGVLARRFGNRFWQSAGRWL